MRQYAPGLALSSRVSGVCTCKGNSRARYPDGMRWQGRENLSHINLILSVDKYLAGEGKPKRSKIGFPHACQGLYILFRSVQSWERTNTQARGQTDRGYKQGGNRELGVTRDRPRMPRDESGWFPKGSGEFPGEQERFPLQHPFLSTLRQIPLLPPIPSSL